MTDFPDEPVLPTLSDRLRDAAVARARARGDIVDNVILDTDGVIDLTVEEHSNPGGSITQPPAVLAFTRGRGAANADMSDLYASPTDDTGSWWRRMRRSDGTASSAAPSAVPLRCEDLDDPTTGHDIAAVVDPDPEIEPTDTATEQRRPRSDCPDCGGVGQRDLFDRVSRISYYSCDDCFTMWQAGPD